MIRSQKILRHAKGQRHMSPPGTLAAWLRAHSQHEGDECLIWPYGRRGNGYGMATVDGVKMSAHRHMCSMVHGPAPSPAHQAAHSCGNGHLGCVHPMHLAWKLPVENKADELLHGTRNIGTRNGSAKLSPDDVIAMRSCHASGRSIASLSRQFGIHEGTAREVIRRMTWRWLE